MSGDANRGNSDTICFGTIVQGGHVEVIKSLKRSALGSLVFLAVSGANAGANSSGGGPGVVCFGADGKLQSVQTLDLYEGKIRFQLEIPESKEPFAIQLAAVSKKLMAHDFFIGKEFAESLEYLFKHIKLLPEGVGMQVGLDVGSEYAPLIPIGCQLQALGYFEADGKLTLSQTLVKKLSETELAAFYAHEALYRLARNYREASNSLATRKMVAYLFSNSDISTLHDLDREFFHRFSAIRLQEPPDRIEISIQNPHRIPISLNAECLNAVQGAEVSHGELSNETDNPSVVSLQADQCRLLSYQIHVGDPRKEVKVRVSSHGQVLMESPIFGNSGWVGNRLALYW